MNTARDRVAPQMADYDQVGDQWVPYLMFADGAGKSLPSVNTDRWGLRSTIGRNGEALTIEAVARSNLRQPIGAVLGSSAVFGVGSTGDEHTIPSYLCSGTEVAWVNLGGRAHNSTQELIRLILHMPSKLDNILVISGVNNLVLAHLSHSTSPVYNSLFSQSRFERAMRDGGQEHIGVRRAWRQLLAEVKHILAPEHATRERTSIEHAYHDVLNCFERDLRVAKAIAVGTGARLCFAMQPLATWLDKRLSPEEKEIFGILDRMSMDWRVLAEHMSGLKDQYFRDVANVCSRLDIQYYNLNEALEFTNDEWLFVDRVHLTDRGCEIAAKVLKREFQL